MFKKLLFTSAAALSLVTLTTSAQSKNGVHAKNCSTMEVHDRIAGDNPMFRVNQDAIEKHTAKAIQNGMVSTLANEVITIPVVVNVLYSNSQENISDAQIESQIAVLNKDFSKANSDWSKTPNEFAGLVANVGIQYQLVQVNRKATTKTSWGTRDTMKSSKRGGIDATTPSTHLNMWVCEIGGGILGYAQFPGGTASTDGVVVGPNYFGSSDYGNNFYLSAPYDKGRTMTHEVGHYLNLRHIWGDGACSATDYVDDTPSSSGANYGCPSYPSNTCSSNDMTMNYMDYTDDPCMYMFSNGQSDRMRALFATGGARESMHSGGGTPPPTGGTYCASTGSSSSAAWLQDVSLGSISNNSGNNNGYGDFTAMSNSMAVGSSSTMSINFGKSSSRNRIGYAVFVDFNADGDFDDAGETVVSASKGKYSSANVTIAVPSSATVGATRMRVSVAYNTTPGACSSISNGEVEDYTLNFTANKMIASKVNNNTLEVFPNPATNLVNVRFEANENSTIALSIFDMSGKVVSEKILSNVSGMVSETIELNNLTKGFYFVKITGDNISEVKKLMIK